MHIFNQKPNSSSTAEVITVKDSEPDHPNYQPHHQIPIHAKQINHKLTRIDTTQALQADF